MFPVTRSDLPRARFSTPHRFAPSAESTHGSRHLSASRNWLACSALAVVIGLGWLPAPAPAEVPGVKEAGPKETGPKETGPKAAELTKRAAQVLERHCIRCHGTETTRGGLSLAGREQALQGGDAGPAFDPADPEASLLLEQVLGDKPAMPKSAPPLSADEVQTLRDWLSAGAPWPEGRPLVDRQFEGRPWWSLLPLQAPAVPAVPDAWQNRVRNPVDAFLLAKLATEGLAPNPEADRVTLIRRLSFDLIGLHPTLAEIERFVNDPAPDAYEQLVDRLLESPRYGERWARHWLDVVHFGETHGYDKDKPRPNAWPYRDYVINALNADLPYAQFVQQQIAGDVLFPGQPAGIEALGFLSAGPWDFIGHAEVPETKIDGKVARHLDRDDMVTNTLQTFCSLTVQCAQCHNHKFDPIPQEDYYRLQAVFAAIDRTDRAYDADPATATQRQQLIARRASLQAAEGQISARAVERGGAPLAELDRRLADLKKVPPGQLQGVEFGYHSEISAKPDDLKWVQVNLPQEADVRGVVLRPCYDDFGNIGAGFGFPVRYRVETADDEAFTQNVRVIADFTAGNVTNPQLAPQTHLLADEATIRTRHVRVSATRLATRSNDYIFSLAELEVRDAQGKNVAAGARVTSLDSIEAGPRWGRKNLVDGLYPDARRTAPEGLAELQAERDRVFDQALLPAERTERQQLTAELAEVQRALAALPPQRMAYIGAVHTGGGAFRGTGPDGGKPRVITLLERGNVQKPGKEVAPGALSAVTALPHAFELAPEAAEGERRRALALWLTDPANPLTWRSIVNRTWHYHFGRGLVETPNDFGRNGRLPTHPELLDWLAAWFRDGGGSLKSLHRLLVCSSLYRQTSAPRAEAEAVDSDNRLLWRMNRRRLEAEAVRDAALQIAGRLNLAMGGPSFQDFVIDKPDHSPHYEYELADPLDPKLHRRAVYRFIVRSQQQPFMTTLDCADPSIQVDRRNESLSALQALALLNNGFMLAMSDFTAQRLAAQPGPLSDRLAGLYRECTGRAPDAETLAALTAHAEEFGLPNLCRVLLNLNEFVFVD